MGNLSTALLCTIFVLTLARLGETLRRNELLKKQENRPLWSRQAVIHQYMGIGYYRYWVERVYDRISDFLPHGILLHPEDHFVNEYLIHEGELLDILRHFYKEKWGFPLTNEIKLEAEEWGANLYHFEGFLKYLHYKQYANPSDQIGEMYHLTMEEF